MPFKWQSLWRVAIGPIFYFYCYFLLFTGLPAELTDIPELGKSINIIAGVTMSVGKTVFVYWKTAELEQLIEMMNQHSQRLKIRGKTDREIRTLRNTFFVNEMLIFIISIFFIPIFTVTIYTQVLLVEPRELVIPANSPKEIPVVSDYFFISYIFQQIVCCFAMTTMNSSNILIGNLYNQIVLHLEVLHHDCELLNTNDSITVDELTEGFRNLARTYQSVRGMNHKCNDVMRGLFVNDMLASMTAVIFSCVEIAIVVNEDVVACFRPGIYCGFIFALLFYWCWLGNRLAAKVGIIISSPH